ncbi:MAG: hypothetical protein LBB98_13865 [Treponema sp.]|jgi:hypothetical protein|nr:hypothetical protein [Treponema sp.]
MKAVSVFAVLVFFLCAAGCSTVVQKAGEVIDGSAFAEKKTAAYRTGGKKQRREKTPALGSGEGILVEKVSRKNGEGLVAIRFEALPTLRLLGSEPDAEGNFFLISLEFLCPNLSGWNEFSRELSGSGVFRLKTAETGEEAILRLDGETEVLDITGGKIQRNSSLIAGDQAISALRNRQERVSALTEWMKARRAQEDNGGYASRDAFEEYWKPILFPELVKAKARPPEWTAEGAVWVRGEDVRWNAAYTEALFPEELRLVRNSGTLLRDWEEAAAWIYLQYEWDNILESLMHEINLVKIK